MPDNTAPWGLGDDLPALSMGRSTPLSEMAATAGLQVLLTEKPKLFVHGTGNLVIDAPENVGKEKAWPLSSEVLGWIAANVNEGDATLETGCGYSTITFVMCGAHHTAIAPDYEQHGRIARWCEDHGFSTEHLRMIDARSQDVIHTLDLPPLDMVLIDGCHAFPAPFIDWYYTAERLKKGGHLLVDDCHIITGRHLLDFLTSERGRWQRKGMLGKTAIFEKLTDGVVVEGYEWVHQPYCTQKRLIRRLRARMGSLLKPERQRHVG